MAAVETTFDNGICTILLNRPEKKNAMDEELLDSLYRALVDAQRMAAAIVVIRGAGKAFCSGGDIAAFRNADDAEALIDSEAEMLHRSIKLIRAMDAIVIAVVEGVAVGAGVGLSLACDLTIAVESAIMNMGYRRIGLTPDGGGSILLPRIVGAKRFSEFYLLSRNITMAEAKDLGLVNVVCVEEELETRLTDLLKDLKALPMETIGPFKELVNRALYGGIESHLDREKYYVAQFASKPLFKQRLEEFFSKKK
jgi:2-(1,2-epoxy-1,2-dihydrophenyl)acetyl-CoA isomerase